MIIGFVLIYLVAQFSSFLTSDSTNYIVAKQGEIEEKLSTRGVVVRGEQLVKASSAGMVQYYYPGGKQLSKNTKVCSILDDYYGTMLQDKINEIYGQISDLDVNDADYQQAFAELDSSIVSSVNSYLRNKGSNNYTNLYSLADELTSSVSKRQDMYSLLSNTKVSALLQEQGIYLDEQSNVVSNLYLPESGTIEYSYDGYEGWTTDQITSTFIQNYKSSYNYFDINMQSISSGTPLYRLITSRVWYLVVYVSEKDAEYFSGEDTVSFIYNSTDELSGTVDSLTQTGTDEYKVVIRMNKHVEDHVNDRVVQLVFTKNSHSGIKISDACLVQRNYYVIPRDYLVSSQDEQGVLAVTDSGVSFQKLDVVSYTEDKVYFSLPDGVSPGFTIQKENSTETMTVSDTETLTGVYVVNGGYAQFEVVTVEYQSQGYCIVSGIEMYDRVKVN